MWNCDWIILQVSYVTLTAKYPIYQFSIILRLFVFFVVGHFITLIGHYINHQLWEQYPLAPLQIYKPGPDYTTEPTKEISCQQQLLICRHHDIQCSLTNLAAKKTRSAYISYQLSQVTLHTTELLNSDCKINFISIKAQVAAVRCCCYLHITKKQTRIT